MPGNDESPQLEEARHNEGILQLSDEANPWTACACSVFCEATGFLEYLWNYVAY
jgi:hypothetical protein